MQPDTVRIQCVPQNGGEVETITDILPYDGGCAFEDVYKRQGGKSMQSNWSSKRDWLLFRSKLAGWQEAYIGRLNKEYIELLCGDGSEADKFWELCKRIQMCIRDRYY